MAIIPVNVARVSQNLQVQNLLSTSRRNQLELFGAQNQIATGLRFQSASEDPIGATKAFAADRHLERLNQVRNNLQSANEQLTSVESAMQEAVDILIEARNITIEGVGDTISSEERESLQVVVDRLIDQMVSIGNRQHLGANLFAGDYRGDVPFVRDGDSVLYRGDDGNAKAIVDSDLSQDKIRYSGVEFLKAISTQVRGITDLNPRVTSETRLSDLRGAAGQGIRGGSIVVTVGGAAQTIDLASAETIGDVVDRLNASLPPEVTANTTTTGISLTYSGAATPAIQVQDIGGGSTAVDLGIASSSGVGPVVGSDLDPLLTPRTRLDQLGPSVTAALASGFTIRNGGQSATLNVGSAETIEDLLNAINGANVGVLGEISADGRSLSIRNRVSGTPLTIEENGGQLATVLGLRSLNANTTLAELNEGRGVEFIDGDDLQITTANGTTVAIDFTNEATLQDILNTLNGASGGSYSASFVANGNGILIQDLTAGGGTLTVSAQNSSPALQGLGLDVPSAGGQVVGRDVNPTIVNSPLTALLEIKQGLASDDTRLMQRAGERLEVVMEDLLRVQGSAASQAKKMGDRTERIESEITASEILLSDVRDADLTEVITRFQQLQTALQANYQVASRLFNLNLLNFLQ
ncbi:MAG: hypothetical protein AB7N71_02210 [Phycisphaerae bacterium]